MSPISLQALCVHLAYSRLMHSFKIKAGSLGATINSHLIWNVRSIPNQMSRPDGGIKMIAAEIPSITIQKHPGQGELSRIAVA